MSAQTTTSERAASALSWWQALTGLSNEGEPIKPADRATIARLRRAQNAIELLMEPAAVDLVRRIGGHKPENQIKVAELAGLLSHVRKHGSQLKLASELKGGNPDRPVMSAVRFRRLMLAESGEERYTAFRRALTMLNGNIDVLDFASAWLSWDVPGAGDQIRARWALAYGLGKRSTETSSDEPDGSSQASTENSQ